MEPIDRHGITVGCHSCGGVYRCCDASMAPGGGIEVQIFGINLSVLLGGLRLRFVLGFEEIGDDRENVPHSSL